MTRLFRPAAVLTVACTSALALGFGSPAQADDEAQLAARATVWSQLLVKGDGPAIKVGGVSDLEEHANLTGLTMAAASIDLDQQMQFEALATELSVEYGATFAGFGFGAHRQPWIAFTEKPEPAIAKKLNLMSTDVTLKWGASASEEQLGSFLGNLNSRLEALPNVQSAAGSVDPETLEIDVTYKLEPEAEPLGERVVHDLLSELAALSDDGVLPTPVTVKEDQDLDVGFEASVKGSRLILQMDQGPTVQVVSVYSRTTLGAW